ncbi:MAG: ral nucleoside transport system permease protein [Bacillota bacterium]|jgi:ABC-type uncharacterized transport system permease subunit|nr:ral nucleoside transport system permease protein [Bacillota bacterium]
MVMDAAPPDDIPVTLAALCVAVAFTGGVFNADRSEAAHLGFPSQFMLMIAYLVTVAVLVVVSRWAALPRRLKLPSVTEEARQ